MTQNQIIALIVCGVALIGICVVVYLRMFPDKWYLYEIGYFTDYEDWPEYDRCDYFWLPFKIRGQDNIWEAEMKVQKRTRDRRVVIAHYRLIETKRCIKGHRP